MTLTTPITDGRGKRSHRSRSARLDTVAGGRLLDDISARIVKAQRFGVVGAVLSGLSWQASAIFAPLLIKHAIDAGIDGARPDAAHPLGVPGSSCSASARRSSARCGTTSRCATAAAARHGARRHLPPRARARRALPRPGRRGRADEPSVERRGARRAHARLARTHDRLHRDDLRRQHRAASCSTWRWRSPCSSRCRSSASVSGGTRRVTPSEPGVCRRSSRASTTLVEETVAGIRVVTGLGAGAALSARFRRQSDRVVARALDVANVDAVFLPLLEVLPLLGILAVLWLGARPRSRGRSRSGRSWRSRRTCRCSSGRCASSDSVSGRSSRRSPPPGA